MKRARTTSLLTLLITVCLLLAGALVWAGCGNTATPSEEAAGLSGLDPFVGATELTNSTDPTQTQVGDITQLRNGKLTFTVVASDPRVSGTMECAFNLDLRADESATIWANWVLTNDKGTWVCDNQAGSVTSGYAEQFLFSQAKGTGQYEGLVCYMQQHMLDPLTNTEMKMEPPSAKADLVGWIQKAM
jgi:hypothetical protein